MQTFEDYLSHVATQGGVNLLFETAMYSLVDELERITRTLKDAGVPFEVIGGMAVNAHLLANQQRSRTFVTRDIDLLVQRADLPAIIRAAEAAAYTPKKMMGGFMLLRPGQQPAEAAHLVFVGERSRSTHPLPFPPIRPESKEVLGVSVPVAALSDLLQMKLNSYRAKDLVHLEIMDGCGLITRQIEKELPPVLVERLAAARRQFSQEEPDVE
jgi:hypothetical protein